MFIILYLLAGLPFVAPQCTFPAELDGNWITSTLSTLTFTSTTVRPLFQSGKTLTCFIQDGTKYVVRSEAYDYGPVTFRDYTCLDLRKVSDTKYMYYELTAKNPSSNNDRLKVILNNTDGTVAEVCTLSPSTATAGYSFMMKEGTLASSVITNPDSVKGVFNVTMPGCDGGAILDVCNDPTRLDFNYTQCGNSSFTDEMIYNALYYTSKDDDHYGTVFIEDANPGGVNPFIPFSCVVAGTSSGNLSMTIAPGDCQDGQTSVSVNAPGIAMELSLVEYCVEPTTEATTVKGTTADDTSSGGTTATTSHSNSTTPIVDDGQTTPKSSAESLFVSSLTTLIVVSVIAWIN